MGSEILFILDDYPTKSTNGCVFVRRLILEMVKLGVNCTVIAPRIFLLSNLRSNFPYKSVDFADGNGKINVYRPYYFHLSSKRAFIKLSMRNHYRAVLRTIQRENLKPDYVYGHFIYQCGISSARIGQALKIPSFCAVGENSNRLTVNSQPYATGRKYGNWVKYLKHLSGIISVSEYNYKLLIESGFITKEKKVLIAPNGIDSKNFYPIDKSEARKKLRIPRDVFVVAFTGAFSERKGFFKLCEALENLDNVYSIFMGKGESAPNCKNVIWYGSVPNNELKLYLSAADIFVLPTNGEGCCNAIIEALACGLPVVSSNQPFNDGILDRNNSIRIDVSNVNEITEAILELKNNTEIRKNLSVGALNSAVSMSNTERAVNILKFMGIKND